MPPKKKLPPVDPTQMINMYEHIPKHLLPDFENPNYHLHNFNLPFRAIVVAPSGSGKSNFILNLINLFNAGKGTFQSIDIVTRDKDEPIYNYLAELSNQIGIKEGVHNLPELEKFDKTENHLVVIDDLVLEKNQKSIEEYYIRCRKKGVSVLYLAQSYYAIPRIIRQNVNYMIILKLGNSRDVSTILKEAGLGLTKEQLFDIYERATAKKMDCLICKLDEPDPTKKFRRNFLDYLTPKSIDGKGLTSSKVAPEPSQEPVTLETPRRYVRAEEQPPTQLMKEEDKQIIYTTGNYDDDWPDVVERINKSMLYTKRSHFETSDDIISYYNELDEADDAIIEQLQLIGKNYSSPTKKMLADINALHHNQKVIRSAMEDLVKIYNRIIR